MIQSLAKTLILAAALVASGCAGNSMPAEELAAARSAVAVAESATHAVRSDELRSANAKLALAKRWTDARDFGPARWLAEQAEVDAELAAVRASAQDALATLARQEQVRKASFRP